MWDEWQSLDHVFSRYPRFLGGDVGIRVCRVDVEAEVFDARVWVIGVLWLVPGLAFSFVFLESDCKVSFCDLIAYLVHVGVCVGPVCGFANVVMVVPPKVYIFKGVRI